MKRCAKTMSGRHLFMLQDGVPQYGVLDTHVNPHGKGPYKICWYCGIINDLPKRKGKK